MTLHGWAYFGLLMLALWFVASAVRHKKQRKLVSVYTDYFFKVCNDESISIDVLENMQKVFAVACRYCAGATMLYVLGRARWDADFRRKTETKTLVDFKALSPESKRKILDAYLTLFFFASYSMPMIGGVLRYLVSTMGKKAKDTVRPGIFLTAAYRAVES